jgi:hypothetical protein
VGAFQIIFSIRGLFYLGLVDLFVRGFEWPHDEEKVSDNARDAISNEQIAIESAVERGHQSNII